MNQPLPDAWVDRIFARMAIRYGAAWMRMWEGVDAGLIKQDWAKELGAFASHPKVLEYGIVNLPIDRPPNAAQFRELCRAAPENCYERPPALPEPERKVDPAKAAAALAALPNLAKKRGNFDWAFALRDREKAGEWLTPAQRQLWREALEKPAAMVNAGGLFEQIDNDKLPPGMRTARDEAGRPVPPT